MSSSTDNSNEHCYLRNGKHYKQRSIENDENSVLEKKYKNYLHFGKCSMCETKKLVRTMGASGRYNYHSIYNACLSCHSPCPSYMDYAGTSYYDSIDE